MRSHELATPSTAHQATKLAGAQSYHINTDGTTLNQKKVQGFIVNGAVLGVTDVTDGSAKAAFEELQVILDNIKEMAIALSLPNAENIGWNMVQSAMSDKAATQLTLNKLIVEVQIFTAINDDKQIKPTELLETFCGMHLGVNLRAAQINGFDKVAESSTSVDSLKSVRVELTQRPCRSLIQVVLIALKYCQECAHHMTCC